MHIHILGICGTFMGGLAAIARAAGHAVSGCDAGVYAPMSTQLAALGIELTEGYDAAQLHAVARDADLFVIGNVVSRGNPLLEAILDRGLPYASGPEWLRDHILPGRWTLAVAGTHGKTTTASMLAAILDHANLDPGFLIGGVPLDFGVSARLTESAFFVIEADEYDTAFFDKRSKFVHYRPRTLVLNNLEYDHADIFADLAAIETQFHHLLRTVPRMGRIVVNGTDDAIARVVARGVWSEVERFGAADAPANGPGWTIGVDGDVLLGGAAQGRLELAMSGRHNQLNALAAIAAARHAGVPVNESLRALALFNGVRRRMEVRGVERGVTVYDDFAHHPTAIASTLEGLRRRLGAQARIVAVLEPRSNTMKLGTMKSRLPASVAAADHVFVQAGNLGWDAAAVFAELGGKATVIDELDPLVAAIARGSRSGDHVVIMSNGAFGGIHQKLLVQLARAE
ncbi:MAG: UDP-N-acetylmuramate:L-alanyl-gamma-D-glutamyl-meso-diaminopimelate ligase [Casimicrobiaceae bacterium]